MKQVIDRSVNSWISVRDLLPTEGKVVETKISDGKGERNQRKLRRIGNLWYYADQDMYVYYTPTHWWSDL